MSAPTSRSQALATSLLLAAVLAAGLFSVHNLDIWLHARTGEWIVQHRQVPTTNVLSHFHADHPAVDDKWGFQVVAHLLFDGLGPDACIAARLALIAALMLVLQSTARALGSRPFAALGFLLLALLAARTRLAFRPDLVSLLFTALVLRALVRAGPTGAGLAWLVPLQVLWANVHGYFITGPLMVAVAGGARLLAGRPSRPAGLRLLGLAAVMALACLLNPAGLDGALHPLRIMQDLSAHADFYREAIIEFRPPFADDPRQPWDRLAYFALAAAAAGAALVQLRAARAADAPDRGAGLAAAALLGLFFAMSLSLRRNMAPFALVAAPFAAAAFSRCLRPPRAAAALPAAFAGLLGWGELSDAISLHDGHDRRAGTGLSTIAYPDEGIAFIARELPAARVFTAFSFGSTFTGRRWPAQSAATDGNTHGYPTAHLIDVMAALSDADPQAFDRVVQRLRLDAALVTSGGPLAARLVQRADWALVCVGVREAVFVLRRAVPAEWLARHDLLARWRAGERPVLPATPPNVWPWGGATVRVPLAEVDQAFLLLAAELPTRALERARAAVELVPGDAEALTLAGLLSLRVGEREAARDLLERAAAVGGYQRLADELERARAQLDAR